MECKSYNKIILVFFFSKIACSFDIQSVEFVRSFVRSFEAIFHYYISVISAKNATIIKHSRKEK